MELLHYELTYAVFLSQSFRLAFALVMGVLMFMMMSLRQGKNSEFAETDTWGCSVINLCRLMPRNNFLKFFHLVSSLEEL